MLTRGAEERRIGSDYIHESRNEEKTRLLPVPGGERGPRWVVWTVEIAVPRRNGPSRLKGRIGARCSAEWTGDASSALGSDRRPGRLVISGAPSSSCAALAEPWPTFSCHLQPGSPVRSPPVRSEMWPAGPGFGTGSIAGNRLRCDSVPE